MLINISFYEASKYIVINPDNYVPSNKGNILDFQIDKFDSAGEELEIVLNEDYFGGVNGVKYDGFDLDNEVFNYQLIPG